MRRESLVRGALALAAAGILVRISGFVYRVPLSRWLQDEGLGIYQMAEPAFWAFLALSGNGIPGALGTLVAEYTALGRHRVVEQTMAICLRWVGIASATAAVLMAAGAGIIARLQGEPRAMYSLMALSPCVFLFSIQSCYRWYLQGRQIMTPSAVANVLEQLGRVAGALTGAYLLLPRGLAFAAAGVGLGAVAGGTLGTVYLWGAVSATRRAAPPGPRWDAGEPYLRLAWRIIRLAWPVALGGLVLPFLNFADVTLIQRGLVSAGFTAGQATALFGQFRGMVYPLVTLPAILTGALSTALLPLVTGAWTHGQLDVVRDRCLMALKTTVLIGLPATLGLMVLAGPAMTAIYATPDAARLLILGAPIAVLYPVHGISAAILNGISRTAVPVRNITAAMACKLVADAVLVRVPGIGIHGAVISSVLMYLLASWLDLAVIQRELAWQMPWRQVLGGPLLSAAGMALGVLALILNGWTIHGPWGTLATSLLVAPVLYAILLGVTGALTWADLREFAGPAAVRLERWLHWPW